MELEQLSDADNTLVGQVLRAVADGPFFDEWEFHTLFGLTRSEVRAVADAWPNVEPTSADVRLPSTILSTIYWVTLTSRIRYGHNGFQPTDTNWTNCSLACEAVLVRARSSE